MKILWSVVLVSLALSGAQIANAAIGDFWSLSGDMQVVSNPSPPIDPGVAGGGTGTWTYNYQTGGNFVPIPASTTNLLADVNGEVPDAGLGWFVPGSNHIMMAKFSTGFNPPAPDGTGNDKTNFVTGDVGGHASIGASWTTDHAGTFFVEWLGYNGRNQAIAGGAAFRLTRLRMSGPSGSLDFVPIVGGFTDGSSGAYYNSQVLSLAAGDTLSLTHEGNDWCGLDLRITERVPEPASWVALVTGAIALASHRGGIRRKFSRDA